MPVEVAVVKNEKVEVANPNEIVVDLEQPVQAHGEMLKKMTFRKPTGGDLMAMGTGYPIIIDWSTGGMMPNPAVMGQMMSQLAAVPPSTIKAMSAEDFSTCAFKLMRFFPPGAQWT